MGDESDISLEELSKAIKSESPKKDIREAMEKHSRLEIINTWLSGHSRSRAIKIFPSERIVFCKRFFSPTEGSAYYQLLHDPNRLYSREKRSSKIIYHNLPKQEIGGLKGPLVPPLLGYDDEKLRLIFEYLGEETDNQKLLDIARAHDEKDKEQKKTDFLYSAVKRIARFGGLVNAHREQFADLAETNQPPQDAWLELLVDDLLWIKKYSLNLSRDYGPKENEALKAELLGKGVNLVACVHDLAELKKSMGASNKVQHGDCRTQHAIGNRFVDLELFGLHYTGRDLVTYFSAEGGISQPNIEEFPRLLAYYLAYEEAYGQKDPEKRRKAVEELNQLDRPSKLPEINLETYATFLVGVLANSIEEHLHLDASHKRYGQEHLQSFIEGIPNYTLQDCESARLKYIQELFKLVAEQSTMINLCPNPQNVKKYFLQLGEILQKMEFVELEEVLLKKIGNGHYLSISKNGESKD